MARGPESVIQGNYFTWARYHAFARRAFAVPNGGHRSKATAGILRAEGVRAGVWDVIVPLARNGAPALAIEFKSGKNTLTEEQKLFGDEIRAEGWVCFVAYDWRMAADATIDYLAGKFAPGHMDVLKPKAPTL